MIFGCDSYRLGVRGWCGFKTLIQASSNDNLYWICPSGGYLCATRSCTWGSPTLLPGRIPLHNFTPAYSLKNVWSRYLTSMGCVYLAASKFAMYPGLQVYCAESTPSSENVPLLRTFARRSSHFFAPTWSRRLPK